MEAASEARVTQAETPLSKRIRLDVAGPGSGVRLFRQDCGVAWHGKVASQSVGRVVLEYPRRIAYGLCPGSPDLVGWKSIEITPEMVGQRVAVFAGLEVKTARGKTSEAQRRFLDAAQAAGALAGVVTDQDQALEVLELPSSTRT